MRKRVMRTEAALMTRLQQEMRRASKEVRQAADRAKLALRSGLTPDPSDIEGLCAFFFELGMVDRGDTDRTERLLGRPPKSITPEQS